jgi:DNA mismatch repair protein MutL
VNRIRLLPEQVANQIAAGEMVERPASVVKELVENSLDAGAARVAVAVRNGGRSVVRVTDDGIGMSRDDALLALERHATSKIARAEDLHSIRSLGFRGEALPSIAAVSRFTLTTRERGALGGTQIEVAGGRILSVQDVGAAQGTSVEARNLFFNLPARRKFLRSVPTETAHVEHIVTLCALAHPAVALQLVVDDRPVFDLAPAAQLADRLRELHGRQLCEQLAPVEWEQDIGGGGDSARVRVHGFIGRAGVSRSDRRQQAVFVNGRPVDSRAINFALLEGYHTALMKGQYPITFLFIEIDPLLVDVNIHPAKREVRFRDERSVREAVSAAVRRALQAPGGLARPIAAGLPATATAAPAGPAPRAEPPPLRLRSEPVATASPQPLLSQLQPVTPAGAAAAEIHTAEQGAWRILGAVGELYVVAESPEGLVLIDQHAAHERVLFEKMLKQLEAEAAPSQKLLIPLTLELEARDAVFLAGNLKTLQRLGIGISEFGEKTFLVDALPPYFPTGDLGQTFRRILDELRQVGEQIHARRLSQDRIATTVCRHAVKARDPLTGAELLALLEQLHRCELPYTCPHGRPTMIQISYAELEKKFGRRP